MAHTLALWNHSIYFADSIYWEKVGFFVVIVQNHKTIMNQKHSLVKKKT
jgi:hypothetical protein